MFKQKECFIQVCLLHISVFLLLGVAGYNGWISTAYHADVTRISIAIFLVASFAVIMGTIRGYKLDHLPILSNKSDIAAMEFIDSKLDIFRDLITICVLLGLIGTLIGFIIAMAGIAPELFTLESDKVVQETVGQLVSGMSVAFYTTVIGSFSAVWLTVQQIIFKRFLSNHFQAYN